MPAGIEVRNDAQILQIDGESPVFGLAASGTTSSKTITVGGLSAPVLAVSGTGWAYSVTNSGSTYTWYLTTDDQPIDYYVFDVAAGIPSAGGVGMEIYDGAGRMIYSTSAKPMFARGQIVLPNDRNGVLGSYGSDRRLATITNTQPPSRTDSQYTRSGFGPGYYDANLSTYFFSPSTPRRDEASTGYVNDGTTSSSYNFYGEAGRGDPPDSTSEFSGAWDFFVIDVTSFV